MQEKEPTESPQAWQMMYVNALTTVCNINRTMRRRKSTEKHIAREMEIVAMPDETFIKIVNGYAYGAVRELQLGGWRSEVKMIFEVSRWADDRKNH